GMFSQDGNLEAQSPEVANESHGVKLGWIQGVLIPCLLNIWGVMLFLRLSWVVAQSGIIQSLIIIGMSTVVCVLTTLSLSAICTNGEVKGGGVYYIISRSLGPEFGASIGIVFAFANTVAASMNTIGFCDSLNDLLHSHGLQIVDGDVNDVRIVGTIAILVMCIICAVGMEWESKAQNFLTVIIVAAIVDFIVGAIIGPKDVLQEAQGFVGFNLTVTKQNLGPDYRFSENVNQDFFSVFAIFFPSVTGIQAGANISGDLKDPASAIPKGTLLSLLISMASYAVFVVFAGMTAARDASGIVGDVANGTQFYCYPNRSCKWGLMNSYSMMQVISIWGPLIYAGCFAATLSTALTNLLSVPRLIQALGIDRIYPGLIFFSKGYGKAGEAYRGYVLTFLISTAFVLIAQLNVIAPLISNFYLASYALINFCTFHAAFIKPLGWRPTFKYYNVWLSLSGFIICVAIMFLISWVTSLITFIVVLALYLLVVYRKPDVNWGSSTQAQTYKTALTSVHKLINVDEHVKNYRPQILVLTGKPQDRPPLVDLVNLITKNNALMLCGHLSEERLSHRARLNLARKSYAWLHANKIKAFYTLVDGIEFEMAARSLLQASGLGKLKPNILVLGYKSTWRNCDTGDLAAYFNVLHDAFDNRISVAILRLPYGEDYSKFTEETDSHCYDNGAFSVANSSQDLTNHGQTGFLRIDSFVSLNQMEQHPSNISLSAIGSSDNSLIDSAKALRRYVNTEKSDTLMPLSILKSKKKYMLNKIPIGSQLSNMTIFRQKQAEGNIDVWWLYDDGGLTMLLPYIISTRSDWSNCKLRVFALLSRQQEAELEERNMASLLSKFRIHYHSLKMVAGITEKPQDQTVTFFNSLLEGFCEEDGADPEVCVSKVELAALQQKTDRQLRLRELLLENSHDARLIVMSLPMPRKGTVSAPLYMAWLEVLTKDMPPSLLVRGNHTSVLTFYS
ncbi:Bumetanide-sensitive sodium-(potassium)-chloride cotransporter, partial [Zootermopsis nevadensis]